MPDEETLERKGEGDHTDRTDRTDRPVPRPASTEPPASLRSPALEAELAALEAMLPAKPKVPPTPSDTANDGESSLPT